MPRDKDSAKLRLDINEVAHRTVLALLREIDKPQPPGPRAKNSEAVPRGRKGGKKGGGGRAKKLTHRKRSAIARKAARARWQREA